MSCTEIDDETEWNYIKTAIEKLEDYFDGKVVSFRDDYIKIYTKVYQLCTTNDTNAMKLYDKCVNRIEQYLQTVAMGNLQQTARRGESLMAEFTRCTNNHDLMMKWYTSFFSYFKTIAVKYHKPSLTEQGAMLYKSVVFESLSVAIVETIVDAMEMMHQGLQVDISALVGNIKIFRDFNVYDELLEPIFVARSREYYAKNGKEWIDIDSTSDFLHKVQRELDNVTKIISVYIPLSTRNMLLNAAVTELIVPHMHTLADKDTGMAFFLQHDKLADIALFYSLCSKTNASEYATVFGDHLRVYLSKLLQSYMREFTGVLAQVASGAKQVADKEVAETAIVTELIKAHDKYFELVNTVLGQNACGHKAVKDSFVGALAGNHSRVIAEALCMFADKCLRKKTTAEEEKMIEQEFSGVVTLLSFLTEKDYFVELYRAKLSRRLLSGSVTNMDMEKSMMGKLKLFLGGHVTLRMEGMLNDVSSAVDVMPLFRATVDPRSPSPLEVKALTLNNWPSMLDLSGLVFPPQMRESIDKFTSFYSQKYPERRLAWIHSQGSLELRGVFGTKRYTLDVSPPQAALLLTYETPGVLVQKGVDAVLAFAELATLTGMSEEVLKKVLHSLSCGKFKILKKISESSEESKVIKTTDKFQLNEKFACPQLKFKVPMPSLESSAKIEKEVEDGRKYKTEAAIVRIMKARKILYHQALVSDVLGQLSLFQVEPKMVKKCIESLIDREYLRRDDTECNKYHYLA